MPNYSSQLTGADKFNRTLRGIADRYTNSKMRKYMLQKASDGKTLSIRDLDDIQRMYPNAQPMEVWQEMQNINKITTADRFKQYANDLMSRIKVAKQNGEKVDNKWLEKNVTEMGIAGSDIGPFMESFGPGLKMFLKANPQHFKVSEGGAVVEVGENGAKEVYKNKADPKDTAGVSVKNFEAVTGFKPEQRGSKDYMSAYYKHIGSMSPAQGKTPYTSDKKSLVDDTRGVYGLLIKTAEAELDGFKDEYGIVKDKDGYREVLKKLTNLTDKMLKDMKTIDGGGKPSWMKTEEGAEKKELTPEKASEFLEAAGGDKDKAREMARKEGYIF